MSLNESSNVPYVLGRLFSVLETIQSVANPDINATIKDRYFNSACATPATAFPTLVKLAQKHLQKMSTPNEAFQQTAHRADGPAARDRLPGAAQPAGAGCL